ncbi:PD-(D/E)XK nuclease family transposase [Candidatus Bodocaedibacter vickermanii]|uniref:Transposase n=1 Tax=Candidatus Bodocaedibacter vickermanii TaxID=2741701 RepID=A0A7L9RRY8_9PROT|nr:transposase [Candidatus Paracaedibacteraceae bacterium 'Lake Konstanz']
MKQLLRSGYIAMLALTVSTTQGALNTTIARLCSARSFVQPAVCQAVRATSTKTHHSVFARPTIDVAFKHMLNLESDRVVLISFLEAFTGRKISKVMSVSEAFPTLKRDADEKQTFLDLACREPDGHIFLAEVQVRKQNFWDARALYYLSGAYSRQLTPDQKWQHLQPVMGISILDHDTHTMEDGAFEKQFAFVDTLHIKRVLNREGTLDLNTKGRSILEWMSLYQVELPRVDLSRIQRNESG